MSVSLGGLSAGRWWVCSDHREKFLVSFFVVPDVLLRARLIVTTAVVRLGDSWWLSSTMWRTQPRREGQRQGTGHFAT